MSFLKADHGNGPQPDESENQRIKQINDQLHMYLRSSEVME